MGGLDDERREILYKNWPACEEQLFLKSVDHNSVEQCQRIHHHQQFLKAGLLRDAGSTPDSSPGAWLFTPEAEAPPKRRANP